jgi:hypothetical protein
MPRSEWKNAGIYEVVLPDAEALARLATVAIENYAYMRSLTHENQALVNVRNLVLPKLVSGRLRLPSGAHEPLALTDSSHEYRGV